MPCAFLADADRADRRRGAVRPGTRSPAPVGNHASVGGARASAASSLASTVAEEMFPAGHILGINGRGQARQDAEPPHYKSGMPQFRMLFPVAFGAGPPRPLEASPRPCVTSIASTAISGSLRGKRGMGYPLVGVDGENNAVCKPHLSVCRPPAPLGKLPNDEILPANSEIRCANGEIRLHTPKYGSRTIRGGFQTNEGGLQTVYGSLQTIDGNGAVITPQPPK